MKLTEKTKNKSIENTALKRKVKCLEKNVEQLTKEKQHVEEFFIAPKSGLSSNVNTGKNVNILFDFTGFYDFTTK